MVGIKSQVSQSSYLSGLPEIYRNLIPGHKSHWSFT